MTDQSEIGRDLSTACCRLRHLRATDRSSSHRWQPSRSAGSSSWSTTSSRPSTAPDPVRLQAAHAVADPAPARLRARGAADPGRVAGGHRLPDRRRTHHRRPPAGVHPAVRRARRCPCRPSPSTTRQRAMPPRPPSSGRSSSRTRPRSPWAATSPAERPASRAGSRATSPDLTAPRSRARASRCGRPTRTASTTCSTPTSAWQRAGTCSRTRPATTVLGRHPDAVPDPVRRPGRARCSRPSAAHRCAPPTCTSWSPRRRGGPSSPTSSSTAASTSAADSVFGVKDSLVKEFAVQEPGTPTPGRPHRRSDSWSRVRFDIVLAPAGQDRAPDAHVHAVPEGDQA